MLTETIGGAGSVLDEQRVRAFVREQLGRVELDDRSLCLVVPDATRNCPLRSILAAVEAAVSDRVRSCTVVVRARYPCADVAGGDQRHGGTDQLPRS